MTEDSQLFIARRDEFLGVITVKEARTLLAAGFLLPSDEFWLDREETRLPLSELPPVSEPENVNLKGRFLRVTSKLNQATRTAIDSVASKASHFATARKAEAASAMNKVLEDYSPRITMLASSKLGEFKRSAESALKDEAFLQKLFGAMYDSLPRPVCRFVSEEQFIKFCFERRERLLGPIQKGAQPTVADKSEPST